MTGDCRVSDVRVGAPRQPGLRVARLGGLAALLMCAAWPLMPLTAAAMSCAAWLAAYPEAHVSVHCGAAPSAALDSRGRLWVAFVQDQHVYVVSSEDGGDSYSAAVRVTREPEDAEHNGENRPKIVLAEPGSEPTSVLVSWTRKTSRNFTGEIRFSRSADDGASFAAPRTINDDALATGHRFDSLFLTESGQLYLTWIDKRDVDAAAARGERYPGAAIYFAISSDLGASFAPNVRLAHNSCECCRIAVAPHGADGVALLWRQLFEGGIRDHALAVLGPQGIVIAPRRATIDDWQLDACPHHGPAMLGTEIPGEYHMSWFSAGTHHKGVQYGRYDLQSDTASAVLTVDATPGAGHPYLARADGTLYLVWKSFDGGATEIKLIESQDDGRSWSAPEVLLRTTAASDHPLLVASDRGAYLSWHSEEFGYVFRAL
jgi:hypothetical protein